MTMEEFVYDCNRAIYQCPQAHGYMGSNPTYLSFEDALSRMAENELLWDKGYSVHLPEHTRTVLRDLRYRNISISEAITRL